MTGRSCKAPEPDRRGIISKRAGAQRPLMSSFFISAVVHAGSVNEIRIVILRLPHAKFPE